MTMDRIIEKKKWTRGKILWLSFFCVCFLLIVFVSGRACTISGLKIALNRIRVAEVVSGRFQDYIPVMGRVMPQNTIYLDAVEGGRVEEIFIDAGTRVKKGDMILRLSNTNLLLDIMYREAELFQQSNNLRNTRLAMEQNRLQLNRSVTESEYLLDKASKHFERSGNLYDKGLISLEEFESAEDDFRYIEKKHAITVESREKELSYQEQQVLQLEASLERMRENLEVVKQKQENLTIKAPVSGQLTSLNADLGESKSPGERLGQIDEEEGFKIRAEIDEHYISKIASGNTGTFDLAGKSYCLRVSKVYPEVSNGKFETDFLFDGASPEGIRRGQSIQIKLELGDTVDAVLLERGGFYQATGGNWAFVLNKDSKRAVRRNIRLGRYNPQYFEVLEGLVPGDRVIISNYDNYGSAEILKIK